MSEGATQSTPASACDRGHLAQHLYGLVVDDLAIDDQAVVAVMGVGVEGHIGLHAEFGHRGFEAADCSLDQALRVVGLGGLIVFFGRVAEEIDR